jgi:peptide/nickel transport system permease protein
MWGYIVRRILATIPVVAVVAVVVFSILHLAPGDPAAVIAGDQATPEQIAAIHARLGLDRPFHEQFLVWLGNLSRGDFGTSIFSNLPVGTLFLQRLEPTIALTITTTLVTVGLAVPIGVIAAWKAGSGADRAVMTFAVLGFSFRCS